MIDRAVKGYAKRMNQVCDYIDANLSATLSLDVLSEQACFSRYHFSRQFSAYAGISVHKYIQLMRLRRASYQLAFNKHYRIIDIALDAQFENPESFSRAFKKLFGQTPKQFRDTPHWADWCEKTLNKRPWRKEKMNVNIVQFAETRVAAIEHRGAATLINETAALFIDWRKESGLSPLETSQTFGIAYDDPSSTAAEDFRFDICGSINQDVPDNPQQVVNKTIPGGRCAVLRHHGAHDLLTEKTLKLYSEWLPQSDEELRDFPCFFHYLNLIPLVQEHELITDIYLPLR